MKKRPLLILSLATLVGILVINQLSLRARAEQTGSSPESGADSRLTSAFTVVGNLGYGSTASGSWGDWGIKWNKVYSAAKTPFNDALVAGTKNGTGEGSGNCTTTFDFNCYTQAIGGVDDYNNNIGLPADAYKSTWVTCNSGNSYCSVGTGSTAPQKQDSNSKLLWSAKISTSQTWFAANNCKYPNGLTGSDGVCNTNGEVACYCAKHTGGGDPKTGCEAYDDGGWRLPTEKELMLAYIDGSADNLSDSSNVYWSATTCSYITQAAFGVNLIDGTNVYPPNKTSTSNYTRCVRSPL